MAKLAIFCRTGKLESHVLREGKQGVGEDYQRQECWVEVVLDNMPLEDKVDGGSNAANDQTNITESNDAATKPIGVKEKEDQFPNEKSTTEDSTSPVSEKIVPESNTLLDSVVISDPFEETDVLVESIYITETEDKTDDIETIDLVTPDSTAAIEVA